MAVLPVRMRECYRKRRGRDGLFSVMVSGPLAGVRAVEVAGLGPGPFCGMLLAELGADVVRVDRPAGQLRVIPPELDLLNRGKRSIVVDLKQQAGVETVLSLSEQADLIFEGFRPGVAERLGFGPAECLQRQPRLVYGRMTGWGQAGPLAGMAGHDINYIALSGALHAIGEADGPPQIPLALVGDFAGGLYLAVGLLSALHSARMTGVGQVVEAAVLDSTAHLMTMFYNLFAAGYWKDERGTNLADGGAPFYGVYRTADAKFMAVGAVETEFFAEFARLLDLEIPANHLDRETWPALKTKVAEVFASKSQAEWSKICEGADACVTPVLSMSEAPRHPHVAARGTFITLDGITQPGPTPRFSGTPTAVRRPPCAPGEHTDEILAEWFG